MPGKQKGGLAGLEVWATPESAKGLYFTDETIKVTFTLKNTLKKKLRGAIRVFYGFGPSGLEGRFPEVIYFDLQPGAEDNKQALERLVAVQGNGVIGMAMPEFDESEAVQDETETVKILKPPSDDSKGLHILYTFTSMEREFHKRFYEDPGRLMRWTMYFTIGMTILAAAALAVSLAALVKAAPSGP